MRKRYQTSDSESLATGIFPMDAIYNHFDSPANVPMRSYWVCICSQDLFGCIQMGNERCRTAFVSTFYCFWQYIWAFPYHAPYEDINFESMLVLSRENHDRNQKYYSMVFVYFLRIFKYLRIFYISGKKIVLSELQILWIIIFRDKVIENNFPTTHFFINLCVK